MFSGMENGAPRSQGGMLRERDRIGEGCGEGGERAKDMLTGTIKTKGAHAMTDLPKDHLGIVGSHSHLPIIDGAPTHMKVDIQKQGLGALLHDLGPKNVEVWGDHGPEKWTGVSNSPP